jgi:hypothetical protein
MPLPSASALCLLTLALAGCGGGGDDESSSTVATRAIEAGDQHRAAAVVLKLSDMPDGWRGAPAEKSENKCASLDSSALTITGEKDSDDFEKQSAQVSSTATVFRNESDATRGVELMVEGMKSDELEKCLKGALEKENKTEFGIGDVDAGELSFDPPEDVDEAHAWQVVIPIELKTGEAKGMSADAYLDVFTLREGDTVAVLIAEDVFESFDQELRDRLLDTLAERLAAPAQTS